MVGALRSDSGASVMTPVGYPMQSVALNRPASPKNRESVAHSDLSCVMFVDLHPALLGRIPGAQLDTEHADSM
jgi:hypothetical protein